LQLKRWIVPFGHAATCTLPCARSHVHAPTCTLTASLSAASLFITRCASNPRRATQRASLSARPVSPLKDHLLAPHESLRYPPPHTHTPSLTWQVCSGLTLDGVDALCFCGGASHLSFMSGTNMASGSTDYPPTPVTKCPLFHKLKSGHPTWMLLPTCISWFIYRGFWF